MNLARALVLAATWLMPGLTQAESFQCPATVQGQYSRVTAFAPDGTDGALVGMGQVFTPRHLRLLVAQLALAHGGEAVPSDMLPPDSLSYQLGRPMSWTLWNGQPPEPEGKLHLVCEYEGGLMLYKPVNSKLRRCDLSSQVIQPSGKRAAVDQTKNKGKPASSAAVGNKGTSAEFQSVRPVAGKAVFSCR